jgi:transposase-like protein
VTVKAVCAKHNISEQTYYKWQRKYGGMEVNDVRKLRAVQYIAAAGLGCKAQACRALSLARSGAYRLRPESEYDRNLRKQIVQLSINHPRYGYRRIAVLSTGGGGVSPLTSLWDSNTGADVFWIYKSL